MSTMYERLGVRPIINGAATLTRLGGSLMPPPVIEAMCEAAENFVDMAHLQVAAGKRIAELTRNEAAYISSGAAAGLALATAACLTGTDLEKVRNLADWAWRGGKDQVVTHRCQRVGYDFAIRQVGVEYIRVGDDHGATIEEFDGALGARTAAAAYFAGDHLAKGAVPLPVVIELAHAKGIPVIVDAAAQLPPPENLWKFTHMGADVVLFSGGKGLCGPQSSGLMLGRPDLIAACSLHGCPNPAIGRPMKVGKEEIAGLVAAVEYYLSLDHDALMLQYEQQVQHVIERLTHLPGVSAKRDFPSEAGQPMPRALIELDAREIPLSAAELLNRLELGDPSIILSASRNNGIYVNPQTLAPGQEVVVTDQIMSVLHRAIGTRESQVW
jgi:D-glucosaminate-6-phosphate ammonia-lyase